MCKNTPGNTKAMKYIFTAYIITTLIGCSDAERFDPPAESVIDRMKSMSPEDITAVVVEADKKKDNHESNQQNGTSDND